MSLISGAARCASYNRSFSRSVTPVLAIPGDASQLQRSQVLHRWKSTLGVLLFFGFGLSGTMFCSYRTNCLLDTKEKTKNCFLK